tara:strand:- start:143 stop:1465 length:1323 start_codon:yes stop_codon:yes gene_type:complete
MLQEKALNKEGQSLKKHADLILCSNPMTLIQRKIFNVLLFNAFPQIKENKQFEISLRELCKLTGYNSRNYVTLIDAIEGMTSLNIKWRVVDSKTKLDDIISASCAVITSIYVNKGLCVYKYNDDIKDKLSYPGIYGRLDMYIQARMKSSFALVLYEICEKFKNIGYTGWLEISDVRKLMGVKENSYKLFVDFERSVLKKAVNEVNEKTNFNVNFEKKRQGRAVKYIKFVIDNNANVSIPEINQSSSLNLKETKVNEKLVRIIESEFGYVQSAIPKIFSDFSDDYILEKINLIKSSKAFKQGLIKNLGGALHKALYENYKLETSNNIINDTIRQKAKVQEKKLRELKLKEKFRENQVSEILINYRKLSYEEQEQIETDFYNKAHERTVKRYCEQGLNNKASREDFVEFIERYKNKYFYLFKDLTSYNNYVKDMQNVVSSQL